MRLNLGDSVLSVSLVKWIRGVSLPVVLPWRYCSIFYPLGFCGATCDVYGKRDDGVIGVTLVAVFNRVNIVRFQFVPWPCGVSLTTVYLGLLFCHHTIAGV